MAQDSLSRGGCHGIIAMVQVTNGGLSALEGLSEVRRLRPGIAKPLTDEGVAHLSAMTGLSMLDLPPFAKVVTLNSSLVLCKLCPTRHCAMLLPELSDPAVCQWPLQQLLHAVTRVHANDVICSMMAHGWSSFCWAERADPRSCCSRVPGVATLVSRAPCSPWKR